MDPVVITIPPSTDPTIVTVTIDQSMTPSPSPAKLKIGTNISDNTSLPNGSAMFANAFNCMTGWFDGIQGSKISSWDANGYPTLANGLAGSWGYLTGYPLGTYTLKYRGPQNALQILNKNYTVTSDGAGGWTAPVQFNAGERIDLRTPGGLTFASLTAPDAVTGNFRNAYLAALKPYAVCRLMQPMQTNGNVGIDWANRITPTSWAQTTSKGVAVEYLAELCKAAGMRPWISFPYKCTDAYFSGVAQAFASFPDPIFEDGNEYWNMGAGFQGNQIRNDAAALGYNSVASGGNGDINKAGAQYHADLTAHMASIIKPIIKGAKIVLGGQAVWNAWAHDALTFAKPGVVDYLAVAPYFQAVGGDPITDVPSLLASCRKWIDRILIPGVATNKLVSDAYGCGLWGYEARQHLLPNQQNAPPNEFTWSADISPAQWQAYLKDLNRMAQLDPGIGDLIDYLFAQVLACGMTLVCNEMLFSNWGRAGFWGLKQSLTDPDNVQSQALARAIAAGNV